MSCSLRKLESRYSINPASPRPTARATNAPMRSIRCRLGLYGFSGSRAGSRILNCSPICRRSRLAEIFESSFFDEQARVDLLQRVVVAHQLDQVGLARRRGLRAPLVLGDHAAQPLLLGLLVRDVAIDALRARPAADRRAVCRAQPAPASATPSRRRRDGRFRCGLLLEVADETFHRDDVRMRGLQSRLHADERLAGFLELSGRCRRR